MDPDLQEPLPPVYDMFIRLISDSDKEYKMFRIMMQKQLARLVNELDVKKKTEAIIDEDKMMEPIEEKAEFDDSKLEENEEEGQNQNEGEKSVFKNILSGFGFFGNKTAEKDKNGSQAGNQGSNVFSQKQSQLRLNSARLSGKTHSIDKKNFMKSTLSKNAFTHGSQLGATKLPDKKDKKNIKNPKFRKLVDGTGVKGKSILEDFLYGDMVFEFDRVEAYSKTKNIHMVPIRDVRRIFESFVNNQTYNLDFSIFLGRRFKEKEVSKTFKLNYKKQILFEFLNDLNYHIFCKRDLKGIKEVKVKDIEVEKKKKNPLRGGENVIDDSVQNTITTQVSTVIEEFEFEELFYGIYDPMEKLRIHYQNFKERIMRFNNKGPEVLDLEKDSLDFEDELPVIENSEEKDKKKKDLLFQTDLFIHKTHFASILRKVLYKKFQQMGIWTRQFYSQDNEKIFFLLKLQKYKLQSHATAMKFPNQLESGIVDFTSMEIVDPFERPFRFKKPETEEYLSMKDKLDNEEFEQRQANALKDFKIFVSSMSYSSISREANKILKLSEFSLHKLIEERLFFFNQMMDRVYSRLNIQAKKNIIDDQPVSQDYWIPWLLYTFVFQHLFKSTKKMEYLEAFPRFAGLIYRLIAFTSAELVNQTMIRLKPFRYFFKGKYDGKFLVHNLWTRLGIDESISPYIPFIERPKFAKLFKTYEFNEIGDRSYFNQMSRNKILIHYLKTAVNLAELRDKNLLRNFFCVHDRFTKDFKSNYMLFEDVIDDLDYQIELKTSKNKETKKIKAFMSNMQDYGDPTDFLEQSLRDDLAYKCCDPMFVEVGPIRDYFGDKVGIMFEFISYYGQKKYYIVWVTLLVFILLTYTPLKDNVAYKYIQFVQMLLINLYSLNFYQLWGRREKLFSMRYGQNEIEEEPESRVNFKGYYVRNLATNSMNQRRVFKKEYQKI